MTKIPIVIPNIIAGDEEPLLEFLQKRWPGQGEQLLALESALASHLGVSEGVAVSSGTAALHLGLLALGIKPGDEVVLPSFSFVACANAIEYCGGKPLFIDVDLQTYNIDLEQLQTTLRDSSKIKAVMAVHQFGLMAPMDKITSLAKSHHVPILEDAACALGSTQQGKAAGSFGDVGCFSFHPRKIITGGEGGFIATRNRSIAQSCRRLRNHGLDENYDMSELGFNYRLTDLQAALINKQFGRLSQLVEQRRVLADSYRQHLANEDFLKLPAAGDSDEHCYQSFVVRLVPSWWSEASEESCQRLQQMRDGVIQRCCDRGVHLRLAAGAQHAVTYYQKKYDLAALSLPVTLLLAASTVALPIYPGMTEEDVQQVTKIFLEEVRVENG